MADSGFNRKEYHAVVLGALLHDIGKFVQRAQDNPRAQRHCQWGYEWYENNLAEKLTQLFNSTEKDIVVSAINSHHESVEYVSLADRISAGMERIELEDEEGESSTDRLISIFSRVSLESMQGEDRFYKLNFLGEKKFEETFPVANKRCEHAEYRMLYEKFNQELKEIDFDSTEDAINHLYFLLSKFTWCVPSAAYKTEPDISLFDHLKTTAAIAGCLYRYDKENDKKPETASEAFWLVGGDVSGIQNYIMSVLNQQGKVARRLRARSLIIQLISETYSHLILHRFALPICNIISQAGGNFYIIVPNLNDTEEKLQKIEYEANEWIYKRFGGELYLPLSYVRFSGRDLLRDSDGGFVEILNELKKESLKKKYRPHHTTIVLPSGWNTEKMIIEETIKEGDEEACTGCHRYPIKDDKENLCSLCLEDIKAGMKLPKAKYIAFYRNEKGKGAMEILTAGEDRYYFDLLKDEKETESAYLSLAFNNTGAGYGFKYMANHVPYAEDVRCNLTNHCHEDNKELAWFDCIAEKAEGDKLLGYLKADVDNMGTIFREGIENLSISRFCTLSRMLEIFFSGYLQSRLNEDYRDLYTVFSGGDDFFIIGPWNRIIDFAKEMRKEFERFTGRNPAFSFSAGIYLAKSHEPVGFCTESVELSLKKAKTDKNRITLFGKPLTWDELDTVLKEAHRLIEWYSSGVLSKGLMYNLREYGRMAEKSGIFSEAGEIKTQYFKFMPLLVYDINRNLTKPHQSDAYQWAKDLMIDVSLKANTKLRLLRIIMEYVLTFIRRKEHE